MLRPVLALERLTFLEPEGKVGYRWGRDGPGQETEVMDYLEFIARVTSRSSYLLSRARTCWSLNDLCSCLAMG
jgi:hypothetical protein